MRDCLPCPRYPFVLDDKPIDVTTAKPRKISQRFDQRTRGHAQIYLCDRLCTHHIAYSHVYCHDRCTHLVKADSSSARSNFLDLASLFLIKRIARFRALPHFMLFLPSNTVFKHCDHPGEEEVVCDARGMCAQLTLDDTTP